MVSYTVTVLTLAAAAAAQATYNAQNQTQVDCYAAYNTCRTTRDPVTGASANQAYCASQYASCLGFNPFNNDGTNTVTPSYTLPAVSRTSSATAAPSASASAVGCQAQFNACRAPAADGTSANQSFCAAQNAECKANCDKAYDTCRTTRVDGLSANQAACAAAYAGCLGENPFTTTSSAQGNSYTTKVVTEYTTVCPTPTTFTHGPSTYTVTKATTLTLPCPGGCTITTPVAPPATTPVAPPATTGAPPPLTTVTRPSNNAGVPTPTSTRAVYTGAAVKNVGSGALLVGALGLLAL